QFPVDVQQSRPLTTRPGKSWPWPWVVKRRRATIKRAEVQVEAIRSFEVYVL
ncbi:UNVERIFIED_CONTAM: hypothetical protein Sindi_1871400, partial [Sesamum indicum]